MTVALAALEDGAELCIRGPGHPDNPLGMAAGHLLGPPHTGEAVARPGDPQLVECAYPSAQAKGGEVPPS